MYLPRRIAGATRIRWKYRQGLATAMAGSYVLGIYNAAGTKVVDTGSVAWAGAIDTNQARSEVIAATTFETGWYYVLIGNDSSAGQASYPGVTLATQAPLSGPSAPNVGVRLATGGLTAPANLLGFTDCYGLAAGINVPTVPLIALSVG